MRSVYARILVWSFVTLFVAIGLFFVISRQIELHLGPGDVYRDVQKLELEQTVEAYETGGPPAAAKEVARLNRVMKWRHYAIDASGRELSTGSDRSALLARLRGR